MIEFFQAFHDPDNIFLIHALAMGGLGSIALGIIGTLVTIKRIGYIAGAISHSILGGIGLALYLQVNVGIYWFDPMLGALFAAIISAIIVGIVSIYTDEREESIIGAIWALGMASGILLIDKTQGYFNLTSYLFGDILLISKKDLYFVILLDFVIVSICILFFHRIFGICFDLEFTAIKGINIASIYIILLLLTAMTIVFLVRLVGVVLVIALLTIPPAIASFYTKKLWHMMTAAVFICMFFIWTGIGMSYRFSLSSGPCIIILAGLVYITSMIVNKVHRKILRR